MWTTSDSCQIVTCFLFDTLFDPIGRFVEKPVD